MKREKTFLALILSLSVIFVSQICVFAKTEVPVHSDKFFVNDYADLIDDDAEQYIFEKGREYNENGGTQVVVLTMKSIQNESIEEFSLDVARTWGVGSKENNDGVLITLVEDSREIRIEVGYGLEGVLNDGKCGRIIRNAKDMLSEGDYTGGLRQIYNDVISEIENPTPDEDDEDGYIWVSIAVLLIMFIILSIFRRRGGHGPRGGGRFYRGGWYGGGLGNGGFGSGGFGGGGGFSGGGGSFGGGGASGKF